MSRARLENRIGLELVVQDVDESGIDLDQIEMVFRTEVPRHPTRHRTGPRTNLENPSWGLSRRNKSGEGVGSEPSTRQNGAGPLKLLEKLTKKFPVVLELPHFGNPFPPF